MKPIDLTDEEFVRGGGHNFGDEVARGIISRLQEVVDTGRFPSGLMVNGLELLWLAESHLRLNKERESCEQS